MDPLFIDVTADGTFATHPERAELPVKVATTTLDDPDKHNTLRPGLTVVGCWGVPDAHFEFDSSFIRPEIKGGVAKFAKLRQRLKDCKTGELPPVSIFGHADPVGSEEYNKILSGRRAKAMYGLLTKDPAIWDKLYQQPYQGDNWQTGALSAIRKALPPGSTSPTSKRQDLFQAYMDFLNEDSKLMVKDFLAQGAGPEGKGDYQGCGECNPVFLLSQSEEKEFATLTKEKKARRDKLNEPNRRVIVFLFKPGNRADPHKWPCPNITESVKGCQSRFWIDGEKRRGGRLPNAHREYQKIAVDVATGEEAGTMPEETFGCRFYYGVSLHSPCEGGVKIWPLRILLYPPKAGENDMPFVKTRFVVKAGKSDGAPVIRGETTDKGELFVPVFDEHTTMTLSLDLPNLVTKEGVALFAPARKSAGKPQVADPDAFPGEENFVTYTLDAGALVDPNLRIGGPDAIKQRLYNLGYGPGNLADWDKYPAKTPSDTQFALKQFQRDQGLAEEDPDLDSKTKQGILNAYGS